jgi:hypothetical protein
VTNCAAQLGLLAPAAGAAPKTPDAKIAAESAQKRFI